MPRFRRFHAATASLVCVVESTMLHQIHLEKIEPVEPEAIDK